MLMHKTTLYIYLDYIIQVIWRTTPPPQKKYIDYIYVIILKSIAIKCDAGVRNQQIGIHVQYYFQGLTVILYLGHL